MVLSLACAMIEEKRCPESAREAINAHRTRWFRVTHSFASVCVVFFPRAVRRAHPLDKDQRERRRCRAKSSLSPPNKECTDVGVPHEKERGNLSLSLGLVAFSIPREGLKTHRTWKRDRARCDACACARNFAFFVRARRSVDAQKARADGGGGRRREIQSVVRLSEQNERRKIFFCG